MKRIALLAAFLVACAFAACANPIEIALSKTSMTLNVGDSDSVQVTVSNNQAAAEDVTVFLAGGMTSWASLSNSEFMMPANSRKTVVLTLTSSEESPAASTLTVSASSKDTLRYDNKDVIVTVKQKASGMNGVHLTSNLPGQPSSRFHLSFYFNPKIYNQAGFNLKDGDDCCVGDVITSTSKVSGEYFGDGGCCDSPPVEYVKDLADTKSKILSGDYVPKAYYVPVCNYLWRCTKTCPQCIGLKDCDCSYDGGSMGPVDCSCLKEMAVICDASCSATGAGQVTDVGAGFKVLADGTVSVDAKCNSGCVSWEPNTNKLEDINVAQPENPWYSIESGTKQAVVSGQFVLNAVKEAKPPVLKLSDYTYNQVNGKNMIKVDIKNDGTGAAMIDGVHLNLADYDVVYKPESVMPGETSEIIVSTSAADITAVKANIDYSSEKTGCLTKKQFKTSFPVGSCASNKDCNDGDISTDDYCDNAGTPDSKCINKKSEAAKIVGSDQTFKMAVFGECNNNYYSCYTPDSEGELIAGDKCYNTENRYMTDSFGRFDLRYDISGIKAGLPITSARLQLNAKTVNAAQTMEIYAIDDSWPNEACVPGGDICTKPYCPECGKAHDLAGTKIATLDVKDPRSYGFDVTSYVLEQYNKGAKHVSFQVRGAETGGMCDKVGEWSWHDVEFDGTGGLDGPTLKLLY